MQTAPSQTRSSAPAQPGHRSKIVRWELVPDASGELVFQRVKVTPGANSAVLHHKALGRNVVVRKVERIREVPDPDKPGRTRLETTKLEDVLLRLNGRCPVCDQVSCKHLTSAAVAAAALLTRRQGQRQSAFVGLGREGWEPKVATQSFTKAGHRIRCLGRIVDHERDNEDSTAPRPTDSNSEYDGPGLLADWGYTARGAHPNAPHVRLIGTAIPVGMGALEKVPHESVDSDGNRIQLDDDAIRFPELPDSRSIHDVAGQDDGTLSVLGPIVERTITSTIHHLPRLAGEREDLFQYGMAVAIPELRKLSQNRGESDDAFAIRREYRISIALKHRLIDLIRRQDAADRNLPEVSSDAARERGIDLEDDEAATDPFDLVFRPYQDGRRDAKVRTIALEIHRQARGLARLVIARAYRAAFGSGSTRRKGIAELREHPDYAMAAKTLAHLWGEAVTKVVRGELPLVYDRVHHRPATRNHHVGAAA